MTYPGIDDCKRMDQAGPSTPPHQYSDETASGESRTSQFAHSGCDFRCGLSIGERRERAVVSDHYDGLGLPRRFVAAHPRRVRRHSRHRDPDGVGSLLKQRNERSDRDVTLHDVAINQSRVTRNRVGWNADLCLERGQAPVFLHLYFGSVVL